ncbi:hypothetical protein GUJ93_ZPchr0005g14863 [Zizania palustris]|uniref:Uncharacterized protein n=1 Tax=Zizania palustris TaxID=103762 RepID=A0A8J5VHZ1_ZIZPA|nr:hypothetical protein GUJ93_ZPchr0005g14863 [Zizania palustris]
MGRRVTPGTRLPCAPSPPALARPRDPRLPHPLTDRARMHPCAPPRPLASRAGGPRTGRPPPQLPPCATSISGRRGGGRGVFWALVGYPSADWRSCISQPTKCGLAAT